MIEAENVLEPPATAPPYHDVVGSSLWDGHPYCTDYEAAVLSGVSERSLRTLQTVEVIRATNAPHMGGGFRRVWHLPEVAVAAATHALKVAIGTDYPAAAGPIFFASHAVRGLYFDHWQRSRLDASLKWRANWAASLTLASHRWMFVAVPADLAGSDDWADFLGEGLSTPVSGVFRGEWQPIVPDTRWVGIAHKRLAKAHYKTVVNLSSIFADLQRGAKRIRKTNSSQQHSHG